MDARRDGDEARIAARPEWAPPFELRQLDGAAALRALRADDAASNLYAWAWIDESAGTIRARSFVPEEGIEEDEATGAAALLLCARLKRPLVIHQGHGSVLACRPLAGGIVEIGGRVSLDERRDYEV